jgi:hypothetical protein
MMMFVNYEAKDPGRGGWLLVALGGWEGGAVYTPCEHSRWILGIFLQKEE